MGGAKVENGLVLDEKNVISNPDDDFFINFLRDYYVLTKDSQFLFGSAQAGRRPDRVFYMVGKNYRLGKNQQSFPVNIGKKLYEIAFDYLKNSKVIVQEGVQGENGYKTGLRIITSAEIPYSAYIAWSGKLMIFPKEKNLPIGCINYIIPEQLPESYAEEIKKIWPEYNPQEPITLFDFTDIGKGKRRVLNLGVDYFGGAFKKPNLTMVWNRGELDGLISYHAGCTKTRILKGLSGTGKTTLTVGRELEQDDAVLGKLIYKKGKVDKIMLIGLEAASFAKSENLNEKSPEWPGLMKSKHNHKRKKPIVLALNIDCENVDYALKKSDGSMIRAPVVAEGKKAGSLQCTKYEKSGTTNGRFIFQFSVLNKKWPSNAKYLKAEGLSFKRYDILEPIFRVINPEMAVALDSACESIITSAIAGRKVGERVRRYAATDFMCGEQSGQALLKLKAYTDLGLNVKGKLIFFIANSGYVGKCNLSGDALEQGEKITVEDSKKLISLIENKKIKNWIVHPVFKYLIPYPKELEEKHGMKNFRERFNLLNYYSPKQIIDFAKRDADERTAFLTDLFKGQTGENKLKDIINAWQNYKMPRESVIKEFYENYYG